MKSQDLFETLRPFHSRNLHDSSLKENPVTGLCRIATMDDILVQDTFATRFGVGRCCFSIRMFVSTVGKSSSTSSNSNKPEIFDADGRLCVEWRGL